MKRSDYPGSPKLAAIETHLKTVSSMSREVTLSFARMEQIMKNPLPANAKSNFQWWQDFPQANAWQSAGFQVDFVELQSNAGFVRFKRRAQVSPAIEQPAVNRKIES